MCISARMIGLLLLCVAQAHADYLYYPDGREAGKTSAPASSLASPKAASPAKDAAKKTGESCAAEKTAININEATAEDLSQHLKGVGPAKAEAIIAWRQENGPFRTLADLDKVKGIGPSILQRNQSLIRFQ